MTRVVAALAVVFAIAIFSVMASPLWAVASDEIDPSETAEIGAVVLVDDDDAVEPGDVLDDEGSSEPDALDGPDYSGGEEPNPPTSSSVKTMEAMFFVSIYKGDELPENYGSVNCNVSNYTSAILVQDALYADRHGMKYAPSGLGSDDLLRIPSISQVKAACDAKGIPFDPTTQRVIWYVVKHEHDGWHVDGAILDPTYGEDPEPPAPVEPTPVDPVDPEPVDPEPVEPEPVDPVKPQPSDPAKPEPQPGIVVPSAPDAPEVVDDPVDEPNDEPVVEPEPVDPVVEPEPQDPSEPNSDEVIKSFVAAVGICGGVGMGLASVGLVVCLYANLASLRRLRKLADIALNARRIR